MIPPAEKISRQGSEGIPLPRHFGDLIEYFMEEIRPRLFPEPGVIAMWISYIGTPVGMLYLPKYLIILIV